jgi:hypothetical protein
MAQSIAFRAIASSAFGRDPAVTETTVTLDPSQWSKRKKNIVLESIRTGVAACGWQTSNMIREMLRSYGSDIQQVTKWNAGIDMEMVRPEMLDDLLAYTSAWIKLTVNLSEHTARYYDPHWQLRSFIDRVDAGHQPYNIPLPTHLSDAEKREFAVKYLRDPSETDRIARKTLIAKITTGETIQIKFAA